MKKNKIKIFTMFMLLLSFLTLTISQVHAVGTNDNEYEYGFLGVEEEEPPLLAVPMIELTNLIMLPLVYVFDMFGIDIETVMLTPGYEVAWFTLSLYDVLVLTINLFFLIYFVVLIFKLFKAIYRKVRY